MSEQEQKLIEKIAIWLEGYSPKHLTTDSGWVVIPKVAKARYEEDAAQILALIKEAGYRKSSGESALLSDEDIVFEMNCSSGIVDTYDENIIQVCKGIAQAQLEKCIRFW